MKVTFDLKENVGYIYLREPQPDVRVETVTLSDEVNVDMAPDGTVYGIELLNANAQLKAGGDEVLVLVNQVLDRTERVPLP